MRASFYVVLFLSVGVFSIGHRDAKGGYTYQHVGSTDPTTEGFIQTGPLAPGSSGFSSGPVINDLGLGIDGWGFVDHSSLDGSYQEFSVNLSSAQVNTATSEGWDIIVTLRVADIPQVASFTLCAGFIDGGRQYALGFGSQANGDPIVDLTSIGNSGVSPAPGTLLTITGAGSGYHTYDLRYDPNTASASLYVDGVDRFDGYTGHVASGSLFYWGSSDSKAQGAGIFNLAQFTAGPAPVTTPEPSTLTLFSMGIIGVAAWRRRKTAT